nr:MAG TPA: hypothetical protein [Caudoviricetes sp.]
MLSFRDSQNIGTFLYFFDVCRAGSRKRRRRMTVGNTTAPRGLSTPAH